MNSQLMPVAWGITVALAVVPAVTATRAPSLLQWGPFAALLCAAMIPFLWKAARPLRTYAGMLLLQTLLGVFFWNALPTWMSRQVWFPDPSGYAAAFIMQSPKVVAAFVMMAVLVLLGYRRQEFFVSSGAHGKLWIAAGVVATVVMGFAILAYMQTTAAETKGAAGLACNWLHRVSPGNFGPISSAQVDSEPPRRVVPASRAERCPNSGGPSQPVPRD